MSFGRKGLAPGEVAPAPGGGFGRAQATPQATAQAAAQATVVADAAPSAPAQDDLTAKREAFIASERARRAQVEGASIDSAPADAMASLRNSARPAQPLGQGVATAAGAGFNAGAAMSHSQEAQIRDAARSMAGRSARTSGGSSGFIFGDPAGRSVGLAYVLWFILGQFSLHRFYCGQKDSAFIQLGMFAGSLVCLFIFPPLGIVGFIAWFCWLIGDLFMIPGMLKKFKAEHDYQGVFS